MPQTATAQVVGFSNDRPDRLVSTDDEKTSGALHVAKELTMLVAAILKQEAIAEVGRLRSKSTLGFLVGRQRDLDGIVVERAHRDVQLDSGGRDLREASGPLLAQRVLQRERASVVEQDVAKLSKLAPESGREHRTSHLLEHALQ